MEERNGLFHGLGDSQKWKEKVKKRHRLFHSNPTKGPQISQNVFFGSSPRRLFTFITYYDTSKWYLLEGTRQRNFGKTPFPSKSAY